MKILSICGSPRKGNSESILNKLKEIFEKKGVENEIILLREKNIQLCDGCVEYCNKELKCKKSDDMNEIMEKIKNVDGYVFISPNYFKMPTGLFKNFIDRSSIFYTKTWKTKKNDLEDKKAIVIVVGTDDESGIDVCLNNMVDNFCNTLGIEVVDKKSFKSHSELKENYNDIFEGVNPGIIERLESMVNKICT